jgi:hypothetical protein
LQSKNKNIEKESESLREYYMNYLGGSTPPGGPGPGPGPGGPGGGLGSSILDNLSSITPSSALG